MTTPNSRGNRSRERIASPGSTPRTRIRNWRTTLCAGALCLVAACGGGSSSGDPGGGGGGGGSIAPSSLSYPEGSYLIELGQTFASLAPVIELVEGLAFSVEPALPQGLVIDIDDGRILGTPAERKHRRVYTVTASNAAGAVQATLELVVVGPTRFAYAVNAGDSTVSVFVVDAENGELRPTSYHAQTTTGMQPEALIVHPSGRFAFVANEGSEELVTLELDPLTGRVLGSQTLAIGAGPHSLALHPDGRFLYVLASGAGDLRSFVISAANGALSGIDAPIAFGASASTLHADPLGRFLIVLEADNAMLTGLAIDPVTGTLNGTGAASVIGGTPTACAIAPDGRNLYVTVSTTDRVERFTIDPDNVELTAASGVATGTGPGPIAVHPRGEYAYVVNLDSASRSRYAIDADGSLDLLTTTAESTQADSIVFDEAGEFAYAVDRESSTLTRLAFESGSGNLSATESTRTRSLPAALALASGNASARMRATHAYVANSASADVSVFAIDASSGALTELETVAASTSPADVALDPWLRFAFVANAGAGSVSRYQVQADGTLDSLGAATVVGGTPSALAVEPSGRFLYVADESGDRVVVLGIAGDGSLTSLGSLVVGDAPIDLECSPGGEFLYVVNRGSGGSISELRIDPTSGALSEIGTALAVSQPTKIEFLRGGELAYATLSTANLIVPYEAMSDTGELEFVAPGTRALTLPVDIDLSSSGRYAYAAMSSPSSEGGVLVFDVRESDGTLWNAMTGALTWKGSVVTGSDPVALESDPDERFLYVLGMGDHSIAVHAINAATGQLGPPQSELTGLSPAALTLALRVE